MERRVWLKFKSARKALMRPRKKVKRENVEESKEWRRRGRKSVTSGSQLIRLKISKFLRDTEPIKRRKKKIYPSA